ncbi:MAG: putative bifunctional diguanylate cyclase/phosphodiesterase [Myxococcota bacterium]
MPSNGDSPGFGSLSADSVSRKAPHVQTSGLVGEDARCPVTGLPDRKAFGLGLAAAVLSAGRSSHGPVVMSLRVEGLLALENRLGRAARESALRMASGRIRENVRPSILVARNNTDEFAILIPDGESVVAIESRVSRILAALHEPMELGSERVALGSTIGVARFPEAGRESELLMNHADAALRVAQNQNASYRFWYEGLGASAQERQSLEKELREAIEHDQLELHFQPMVDTETGEIQGMESLARWRRPGYGWVPPLEFFAVAKDCGVLVELEEWIVRRAASVHANWRRRGISRGRVSINCVPSFLARPNFEKIVLSILDKQGLDGSAVEFEVEQSSLFPESAIRLESLESLRASGIHVTVDDFGASSFPESRLIALPVDRLKLAASCLPGPGSGPVQGPSIRQIAEMAAELKIEISAKGVEHASQRAFLREQGCPAMQGYLCGRPMTPLDAAVLLRRGYVDL